ncbi:acyl-CoA dehydrogenase family protein [Streptomyces sp. NBC_00094]|uniref:acyl-CoA dehydrogenase family protein n=1 Tax=Streptomyces sp. NBC_00094 TaxID=2903620 RepID=UPI00225C4139|nr:acyl-CoA dehydrogenase family protein [Streptomyces sp. NBC_00094]MCX5395017.1 acyl-CoA dehydrogenase family protein [Streptomyces sp. NBC_00094]
MESTRAPLRNDLVGRAAELVPFLRERSERTEEGRRLPEETIGALADAGVLRMRVPSRYGGHEADMRTMVEVLAQIGRGDGSTAWTVSVWGIFAWLAGMYPHEVREEVFADPDARISGILSKPGTAIPVDGGYLVSGRWAFNTGVTQSGWNMLLAIPTSTPEAAPASAPSAGDALPLLVLTRADEMTVVDDWHASGLRGTGSVTSVAKDVFVPSAHALPMRALLKGHTEAQLDPGSPFHRSPLFPTVAVCTVGTALGLARAAQETFLERLPGRRIAYTDYASQREAPVTHLQVGEAAMLVDEAEFHARRAAELLDAKATGGETWTVDERVRVRTDVGAVCRRAKESVDILATASGASSLYSSAPIQRIERDMRAVHQHASLHPNTTFELYGRVLCGLAPNTRNL